MASSALPHTAPTNMRDGTIKVSLHLEDLKVSVATKDRIYPDTSRSVHCMDTSEVA